MSDYNQAKGSYPKYEQVFRLCGEQLTSPGVAMILVSVEIDTRSYAARAHPKARIG